MSVQQIPAPARSDVNATAVTSATGSADQPYRRHGLILASGAAIWAVSMMAFGLNPTDDVGLTLSMLSAGAFQIGLLALLRVFWRSKALGSGRVARGALRIETGLVLFAIGSTLADMVQISDLSQPGWALLDATWPLSMLGMMLLGIRVAVAGRWTGVSRVWPLIAESWAPVVLPIHVLLGAGVSHWVAPIHLLVGYTTLGILVARKRA